MEEKRRDAGNLPPSNSPTVVTPMKPTDASPASAEPASTRRRAGSQKRKFNNGNTGSNSNPMKRLAREKAAISLSSMHNGPYTRAAAASSSAVPAAPLQDSVVASLEASSGHAMSTAAEEANYGSKDWQALEAAIEAEYEAIRSRDSNAHVVPTHCGWFSWTKLHPLEEQTLPSFFNGKSEDRTPDVYLEIRNWIMTKFHTNPSTQIELENLSELKVGDLDARQEVMEFLDYWGLINFHPFPPTESSTTNVDGEEAVKTPSLVDNLYHFETVQSCPPVAQRTKIATPAVPSGLFPEPAIAEELVKPEEPEYHCNSCSADCSRKRYHCQTQADYDLCNECFNNGKFGSAMLSSDFILMEPAEVPGVSGGNWTDQETLLLLEALELYKENWNEIAEHVATKTKAQCILHFVQMPIEDTFLDCNDEIDADLQQNADPTSINCDSSASKDSSIKMETKNGANGDQASSLPVETSKQEDTDEIKLCQETGENCAIKALREAFEAVGTHLTPGGPITFAEAGNPVMALAAFLVRLAGPDIITASSRCSIKSISCSSPSMQVAARHCFVLEDPPDDRKEPDGCESSLAVMADQNAQNDENQKEEKSAVLDGGDPSNEQSIKNTEDSAQDGKIPLVSSDDNRTEKSDAAKESGGMVTQREVGPSNLYDSSNSELLKDEPRGTKLPKDHPPIIESQKDHPPNTEVLKDQTSATELLKDPSPATKVPKDHPPATKLPKDHPPGVAKESDGIASKEELVTSSVKEKGDGALVGEPFPPTEAPKDADMMYDLVPAEKNEPDFPVTSNTNVDKEANAGNQVKESEAENHDSTETKDDRNIDNKKRAAITAISAAAVKAKLLANQEEDQIRQLATMLIEKQLHKLETKLACFNEMESVVMRVREQLERSRQKLYHERAQIIAARLGLPASSSRTMPQSLPTNRVAMNFANLVPRPSMNMIPQRPLISRPMMSLAPPSSNPFASAAAAGSSIRPSSQDKLSSVGMK